MEVLCEIRNSIARLTLNRPAALNALSLDMIEELSEKLRSFRDDPNVRAVLIHGTGEKAFCAGGDIRAIRESYQSGGTLHRNFFEREYALDHLLRFYPKCYLVDMNGITMGGGMGLAQGSHLRMVGDRTRIAMPEVGIGLFPDAGGSFFLSRVPGAFGLYLALTGTHVGAADALYLGLADHYLSSPALERLPAELDSLKWTGNDRDSCRSDVERLLLGLSGEAGEAGEAPLGKLRAVIDQHFAATSIAQLFASLAREDRPRYAQWAADTLRVLESRSPTSLGITLRLLRLAGSMSLADCLRMELGLVQHCMDQGDFLEGVRALIIDKDLKPRWHPAKNEDVTDSSIDALFRDPWAGSKHPLADLQAS